MVARLLYDKGYTQYVEAAKAVRHNHPEAEFLLLGSIDSEYPNHVDRETVNQDVESGSINYLGYVQDVRGVMESCDCVVLPSYYNEGLSRVLMEALALRKAIITTDIAGCRETVEDGVNGFLCRPRDTESLIDALEKFLALSACERERMGVDGREKAERVFDIERVIDVYHSITDKYL